MDNVHNAVIPEALIPPEAKEVDGEVVEAANDKAIATIVENDIGVKLEKGGEVT